jgi:hypothetical protein
VPTHSPLVRHIRATLNKVTPPPTSGAAILARHVYFFFLNSNLSDFVQFRDYTMIVLAFKSLLRGCNMSSLLFSDLWVDAITLDSGETVAVLFVLIRDWITRNGRAGRTVLLCRDEKHPWKCPVLLYFRYLEMLISLRPAKHKHGLTYAFCQSNPFGKKLSSTHLNSSVKRAAARANLSHLVFTGHGTRRGGATEAFRANVDKQIIKRHGDWKSDCVEIYHEESMEDRLEVSRNI